MEQFILILVIVLIIAIVVGGVFYKRQYEKKHPCLEWKTYCYYKNHDISTGVGPNLGGKGGVAVTIVPTSAKIYINCEERENTPEKVYEEKKCVLRK